MHRSLLLLVLLLGDSLAFSAVPSDRCSGGLLTRRRALVGALALGVGIYFGRRGGEVPADTSAPPSIASIVPPISEKAPRLGPLLVMTGPDGPVWPFPWPSFFPDPDRPGPESPELKRVTDALLDGTRVVPGVRVVDVDAFPEGLRKNLRSEVAAQSGVIYVPAWAEEEIVATPLGQEPLIVVDKNVAPAFLVLGYYEALYDREIFPERFGLPAHVAVKHPKIPADARLHPFLWSALLRGEATREGAPVTSLQLEIWAQRERTLSRVLAHIVVNERLSGLVDAATERALHDSFKRALTRHYDVVTQLKREWQSIDPTDPAMEVMRVLIETDLRVTVRAMARLLRRERPVPRPGDLLVLAR